MIGLAVELTSRHAALALADDAVVRDVERLPEGRRTSGLAVACADKLLRRHGLRPADLGVIYVSNGPGAFTGTRVAVTFAKMLAGMTGAAVVPVATADVVVRNVPAQSASHACVVFDARRGFVWASLYGSDGTAWRPERVVGLLPATQLADQLPAGCVLVGEGLAYHKAALAEMESNDFPPFPRVEVVVEVGYAAWRAGGAVAAEALVPRYVRRPEAEEKRLAAGQSVTPAGDTR